MDLVFVTANIFFEFLYQLRQLVIFAKQVLEYLRKSRGFLRIVVPWDEILLNNFRDRYINAVLDIRKIEIILRLIVLIVLLVLGFLVGLLFFHIVALLFDR